MAIARNRWPLFFALVLGSATLALLWYVILTHPQGEAVPASGGRYVEGVVGGPERINPLFAGANQTDADLSALIYSGLVRLRPDGTAAPDLAERWEITESGRTYVFHLRRGVVWHDGNAFSAQDVAFTFESIASPGFKGEPALVQLMEGVVVSARDALTVEFTLEQTFAPFLSYLTVGILPEHLLRDLDANELFNAPFNAHPIGTGPYRLAKRADDSIELESNPTYYLGPPHISTIELRVFADDLSLQEAVRTSAIDGALLARDTPAALLDILRNGERYALRELTGSELSIIYLDTRSPLFNDVSIRLALQQAIDVGTVLSDTAGTGVPAVTGIPPQSWAYPDVEAPEFSPGSAASALERAGWTRGRDGIRHKDALRLSFTLSTNNVPQRVAIAESVARQWRAIGAEIDVQALDSETFLEEHLLSGDFEAAIFAVDPGPDPDPYPFWHSSQLQRPGRNLSAYENPRMDDVLERARQTTDLERRKELYAEFAEMLLADAPALPLFFPARVYAQTRARGFEAPLLITPAARFNNVHEWYIETRVIGD